MAAPLAYGFMMLNGSAVLQLLPPDGPGAAPAALMSSSRDQACNSMRAQPAARRQLVQGAC